VFGEGTVIGAVYVAVNPDPEVTIVPVVEFPPATPLTDHARLGLVAFVTAAVNWSAAPTVTLPLGAETVMAGWGVVLEVVLVLEVAAPPPQPATVNANKKTSVNLDDVMCPTGNPPHAMRGFDAGGINPRRTKKLLGHANLWQSWEPTQ
jgi:hypothetical protein